MTDKRKAVLTALKSRVGDKVSAREIARVAKLSTQEVSYLLGQMALDGLVTKIPAHSRGIHNQWRYDGGEE